MLWGITYRSQFSWAGSIRCESRWLGKAWAFWTQTRTVIFTKTKSKSLEICQKQDCSWNKRQQVKYTWKGLGWMSYCVAGLCAGQVVCALRWRTASGAGWGRDYRPGCRGADHRGVKEAKMTVVSHSMIPVEHSRKYVNPLEDTVIYTVYDAAEWSINVKSCKAVLKMKQMWYHFFKRLRTEHVDHLTNHGHNLMTF